MLIKGYQTIRNQVNVEVDPEDALKAVADFMLKKVGLYFGCESLEGKIVEYHEEGGGNHSWTSCKTVTECPTLIQLQVVDTVNKFAKEFEKLKWTKQV